MRLAALLRLFTVLFLIPYTARKAKNIFKKVDKNTAKQLVHHVTNSVSISFAVCIFFITSPQAKLFCDYKT